MRLLGSGGDGVRSIVNEQLLYINKAVREYGVQVSVRLLVEEAEEGAAAS